MIFRFIGILAASVLVASLNLETAALAQMSHSPTRPVISVDDLVSQPESIDPMSYIDVVASLWGRGDRAQAAFWYYVWQIRTRAWARSDHAYAQARGALSESVGRPINEWAGSDRGAWLALTRRAIAYEQRLPLPTSRPAGVEADRWESLIRREREAYRLEFEEFISDPDYNEAAMENGRRENNLYVGPWQDPGSPIPDDWS